MKNVQIKQFQIYANQNKLRKIINMKETLRELLREFLSEDKTNQFLEKFYHMDLTVKLRKHKGRWNKETLNKLIKERGDICSVCKTSYVKKKLTLDHIISKEILLEMKLGEFFDDEDNLDLLCFECNGRKGSRLDFSNPKTVPLLEKYISIYKIRRAQTKLDI